MPRVTTVSLAVTSLILLSVYLLAQPPQKRAGGPGRGGPPVFPLLQALDANNDGEVSAAEKGKRADDSEHTDDALVTQAPADAAARLTASCMVVHGILSNVVLVERCSVGPVRLRVDTT